MTNIFTMGGRLRGAVAAVAVIVLPLVGGLAACGTEDSLLEATDPDIIDPAALNTFEGAQALYFGALTPSAGDGWIQRGREQLVVRRTAGRRVVHELDVRAE